VSRHRIGIPDFIFSGDLGKDTWQAREHPDSGTFYGWLTKRRPFSFWNTWNTPGTPEWPSVFQDEPPYLYGLKCLLEHWNTLSLLLEKVLIYYFYHYLFLTASVYGETPGKNVFWRVLVFQNASVRPDSERPSRKVVPEISELSIERRT
jgi:hypothetical protein